MSTPWKTDQWFTSPLNFADEVRKDLNFPEKIQIHDVSLRDGEQQCGLVYTRDDKVRIAEKLAEVGIHRIEAGMPVVSKQDEQAIRDIVKLKLPCEIFAFSRCMVDDVKRAADCGVQGVVVEIPSSEHIIRHAYQWPVEKAIDLSITATLAAKEEGLYTVWFPIDATRADLNWLLDMVERVATEGHMDALAVVDTFGGTHPHAIPYLVRKIRERVDKPLETHFHDDFGCGVANTLMGLAAGCTVAHTTVTGIGERAGNASYEDMVLALRCMYDVDIGIKTRKMVELSNLVREVSDLKIPTNRPIVGDLLYQIESGIIASWYKNCGKENELELCPFSAAMVGQEEPDVVIGKGSGIDSVGIWLERLGIQASEEERMALLMDIKEKSMDLHRLLTVEEFKALAGKG
ncbi:MAG: LeuA family protein [Nitrospinota bacterium]